MHQYAGGGSLRPCGGPWIECMEEHVNTSCLTNKILAGKSYGLELPLKVLLVPSTLRYPVAFWWLHLRRIHRRHPIHTQMLGQ
jgi:hypothetical protein